MIKTVYRKVRRFMPAMSLWLFVSALLAAALHVGFVFSPAFADFFNEHIASFFRALFAHVTGWIPFSLAETLILFVPVLFVSALVIAIRCAAKGWRRAVYHPYAMRAHKYEQTASQAIRRCTLPSASPTTERHTPKPSYACEQDRAVPVVHCACRAICQHHR